MIKNSWRNLSEDKQQDSAWRRGVRIQKLFKENNKMIEVIIHQLGEMVYI